MDTQSFSIELLVPDDAKAKVFEEHILPSVAGTLSALGIISAEQFYAKRERFMEVLHKVFEEKFEKRFKSFSGIYHPPTERTGPRYDLGLCIDKGEEGLYPIQVILIGKPADKTTLH